MGTSHIEIGEIAEIVLGDRSDAALGVIGCRSSGESYPPCEYDLFLVSEGGGGWSRSKVGGIFVDVLAVDPEDLSRGALGPLSPALKDLRLIRDPEWMVTPLLAEFQGGADRCLYTYAEEVMFNALAKLGRFEESAEKGFLPDAGFWLQSSAYSFASAILAYERSVPRMSHILQELRRSKYALQSGIFHLLADTLGLNLATEVSVARRLEVLAELLDTASKTPSPSIHPFSLSPHTYKLAEERSLYLLRSHAISDAYCYLGYEATQVVQDLYEARCKASNTAPEYHSILHQLLERPYTGLSSLTVRLMGLNADLYTVEKQGSSLKSAMKMAAKAFPKG